MKKEKIFGTLIICFVTIYPVLALVEGQETEIPIAFSITLLSPNTQSTRNQWAVLIQKQLPKIGIGVYLHESTGWDNIAPRTWSYPLIDFDYIPTYAEGGFDALFVGRTWEMDLDLKRLFSTGCWISGDNYYQYVNPFYDNKLNEYVTTYDQDERDQLAYELQEIIYEDLPAISILYEFSFFVLERGISGFNPLLNKVRCDHSENWNNSEGTDLIYCNKYEPNSNNAFQLEKENFADAAQNFDQLWAQCVYGSLYQRNLTNNRWEPYVAKNATIIPHYYDSEYVRNMSIFVDIEPEAKFSNGDPVLAEDIKYSYDLHFSTYAHSSTYGHLLTKYFSSNDSIVVIDSDTVRFDLRYTYNFPYSLLSYGIIDKSTVEPIISTYGYEVLKEAPFSVNASDSLVTSCGPFKLDTYDVTENKVVLTNNEYWFGPTQGLNNITFISIPDKIEVLDLLREDKVDVLDENYNFLREEVFNNNYSSIIESFKPVLFSSLKHQELGINMKHPVMGTGELTPLGTGTSAKNIRKAISHAIPRLVIINDIIDGMGFLGVTPIPNGCIGFNSDLDSYAYDLDLAIEYMESVSYFPPDITPTDNTTFYLIPAIISLAYMIIAKWKKKR